MRRLMALIVVLALVAVACSSSDVTDTSDVTDASDAVEEDFPGIRLAVEKYFSDAADIILEDSSNVTERDITGIIIELFYWITAGSGVVTAIILEEENKTTHRLAVSGISDSLREGQQIRVVFIEAKEGNVLDEAKNSSFNQVIGKVVEEGTTENEIGITIITIRTKRAYWWTIIEFEILSEN